MFQSRMDYVEQSFLRNIGLSQNINLQNNFLSIPTNTDDQLNVISDYRDAHLGINPINPNIEYYNKSLGAYQDNTAITPQKQIYRENRIKTTNTAQTIRPMKVLPIKYLPTEVIETKNKNKFAEVFPIKNYYNTINNIQNTKKIQPEYFTNNNNISSSNNVQTITHIQPINNVNSFNNITNIIPITNIPYSTEEFNINNYQTQDIFQTLNYSSEKGKDDLKNDNIEIPPTKTENSTNNEIFYENENKNINKEYYINYPANEEYNESIPNSFIHNSPLMEKKVKIFSPIQSPMSNYEIQSYNQDQIIYKLEKELFNLKAENESFKKQLQEFRRYKSEAAEVKALREKVEQLSSLKENLKAMSSLKAQLEELNELKLKVKELEKFKFMVEQKNSNSFKKNQFKSSGKKVEKIKIIKKKIDLNKNLEQKKERIIDIDKNINLEKNKDTILKEKTKQDFENINIIHNMEELELLIRKINKKNKKITFNLIYKATVDSDKAAVFHKKCDEAQKTLVLIETDKGKRFGGYTSVNWKGNCVDKMDEDAFVFSLDKMKIYENIPGEEAIGCYPKFGPVFLGCQIRIYDEAFQKGGTTYEKGLNYRTNEDFELTGGDRVFNVKEIEVYEVIPQ